MHDKSAVFVTFLGQGVKLSYGIVESLKEKEESEREREREGERERERQRERER